MCPLNLTSTLLSQRTSEASRRVWSQQQGQASGERRQIRPVDPVDGQVTETVHVLYTNRVRVAATSSCLCSKNKTKRKRRSTPDTGAPAALRGAVSKATGAGPLSTHGPTHCTHFQQTGVTDFIFNLNPWLYKIKTYGDYGGTDNDLFAKQHFLK